MSELNRGTRISLIKDDVVLVDPSLKEGALGIIAYSEYGPSGLEGYMIDFANGNSWLVDKEDVMQQPNVRKGDKSNGS